MSTDVRTASNAELAAIVEGIATVYDRPALSDPEIASRIKTCLSRQAQVDADMLRVTSKHGTVTLDGQVRSWSEWHILERIAWSTPCVTDVRNNVVISYPTV